MLRNTKTILRKCMQFRPMHQLDAAPKKSALLTLPGIADRLTASRRCGGERCGQSRKGH